VTFLSVTLRVRVRVRVTYRAGTKVGFSPSKLRLHNLRKLRTFVELCAVITVVTIQTIILYL